MSSATSALSVEESPILRARALAAFALTQAERMNLEAWKSYCEQEKLEADPISYWNDIIRYARQQEEILLMERAEKAARLEKGAAWINRQVKTIAGMAADDRSDAYDSAVGGDDRRPSKAAAFVSFFDGLKGFQETLAQHPQSRHLVHKTLQDAYDDCNFVHCSLSVGYELEQLLDEITTRIDYAI